GSMAGSAGAPALPAIEPLLADKPQHRVEWGDNKPAVERDDPRNALGFDMKLPAYRQDMGELHNLSIRRGTLTDEDRFAINDHIVQTLIMLKQLPWPRHLERVPDIAANHHEKMDGTGYPRRLPGEALHLTERVMAVADVFEALTAADRPYKLPKTLSESLRIMAVMCKERHLDTELYLYFLRSRIWLAYAQQHMNPSQIDDVDIEALARIAQG
ncbi:HD-GYP domain-containing protein, partial [Bordetella pertussis]|uniref:HD-GYP domain-containing protein n=2 Tax=Bordetella pertussis TaxID=520 RepID=UPI0021BB4EF1